MTLTGFGVTEIKITSFTFFSGAPDEQFEMTIYVTPDT